MKRLALFALLAFAAQVTGSRELYIYCEYTYACVRRRVAEVALGSHGRRLLQTIDHDYVQPVQNIQNDTHTTVHMHAIGDTNCDAPMAVSHVTHSTALTFLHQKKEHRRLLLAPSLLNPSQFGKSHICERVHTGYGGGFFLMRALGEAANAGVPHVQISNATPQSRTIGALWKKLMSHGPILLENENKLYQVTKRKDGTIEHRRTQESTHAWPWMNDLLPVSPEKQAGFFVYAWCSKTNPGGIALAFANYGGPIHLQLSQLPALPRREYFLTPGPVRYSAFRRQFYGTARQMTQTNQSQNPPPQNATSTLMFEMQTIAINGQLVYDNAMPSGAHITQAPTLLEGESPQEATQRIPIPSYSYGFIVLENARVSACSSYMRGSLSTKSPQ